MSGDGDFGADEREWMGQALALGALGGGETSPNPRVGCVLVRDGVAVGRGYHRAPGEPHAEADALSQAGARARGATLYVNLEPCAHHGRTPPCSALLVPSGVRAVVASIQDPNPLVDGRGFAELRRAGIEVRVGLLAREARSLNAPFIHWHRCARPFVTVKAALSADGMLAGAAGASRWITGAAARSVAHSLRARHDAILVGAETVRRDDPRLTVRSAGAERFRRRIVLSPSLDLDARARVFEGLPGAPRTRIYTVANAPTARLEALARVADVVPIDAAPDGPFLAAALEDLGRLGVQSLLVEGGARTIGAAVAHGLAQRFALFYASGILGSRGGTPFVDLPAVGDPAGAWRLQREQVVPLGADLLVLGGFEAGAGAPPDA